MSLKEVESMLKKTKTESKMKLTKEEERDLISKYRGMKKITYQQLMTQMAKEKKGKFPQPIRAQPTMEIFTSKDDDYTIAQRIVKLTAKDIKIWGNKIIADVKFNGIRGMIVVDPKTKEVRVLSRTLKTLKKFEKNYGDQILENISDVIKDKTIMDAELYALGANGEILPGHMVTGWAKNPSDDKYSNIKPSVEVFDLIVLNSKDIRKLPLKYRKRLLEVSLKKDADQIIETADTRMMDNSSRLIDWLYQGKVNKRGFEGLVLKDPNSSYFYGQPDDNPWRKVKGVDTLDLELKAVESYPHDKAFRYYKHWIMTPKDAEMEVKADKGIKDAEMNEAYYIKFSKKMIKQWKSGILIASGPMIKVDAELKKEYGISKIPSRLDIPENKRQIVEIFVEQMTDSLQVSGTKIVGIREDKKIADSIEDMVKLRDYLRGV